MQYYISVQPDIRYVGYSIPHPLKKEMRLKIMHNSLSPEQSVAKACESILVDLKQLQDQFKPYVE